MKPLHRIISISFFILIFSTASCQKSQSENNTENMELFASGLSNPVCITNAGDNRLFVVDQAGYIRIVDSDGVVRTLPFLDIRDRVTFGGERGLLGLAFHPEYKTNGFFYVNYVGTGDITNISRFKVNSANPEIADPTSELKIMTIAQPFANHNGGTLCFGPDGYLYIGMGDGGSGGDPGNRAQNPMTLLGKMLRIDINNGNLYSIPTTNPFSNSTTTLPEIWSLGLRNPWKFSFDRLTGDMWIADVGQNAVEEVNFQAAASLGGENYGWRCYEGNQTYSTSGCAAASTLTFPAYTYPQGPECSVTGGYVYRGDVTSAFYGHYFFTDYCSDRIWTLHKVADNWVKEDFGQFTGNNFSTFGEDSSGQLYVAGRGSGKIYRVVGNTTGINDSNILSGVKIIQVPYSNKIRIETGYNNRNEIQISLNDIKGIVLHKATTSEANYEFDPGKLAFGTYILNIVIDGKKMTQKLIK
ncbi:MAG: PQQ-dependent sugar dehydrogenase [Prolixibacteraceae bacterium]|nr:PQQ-dependent sugar dehydrogenase [Prolixibacteraceae bacterium]